MTDTLTRPPEAGRRPATPIDPRMRARRIEVRRDHGRRRLRRVVVLGVVLAVVAVAFGITQSPLLAVGHLRVAGSTHTPETSVLAAGGLHRGDPLVGVHAGAVAHKIEALPWIDHATVVRRWSGTVLVKVTERRPVAVVAGSAGRFVVDAHGRVLAPAGSAGSLGDAVPVLAGRAVARPGASLGRHWALALRIAGALPPSLRRQVATVHGSRLALRTGTEVTLCDGTQLAAKVRSIRAVLAEVSASGDVGRLNVCVPSAPA
ncbi:MAG TPA: FtsQ-type POTRA domain-containing protein, partial [Acidimicrobiales bacterium]